MFVRFHGVRGSTPICDLRTWRYGGNTACVEIETPGGQRILVDAGTGLRPLGRSAGWAAPPRPLHAFWLLSHYHWDHIQGLPFFPPLYEARHRFEFFGPRPEGGERMEAALQGQMLRPYFPVDLSMLSAARAFTEVAPGLRWRVGDATVEAAGLHHPQGCLGFRIETATGTLAYATDTEPGDPAGDAAVRHLARGADVLVYDAQYAPERLASRRGWGHSTWEEGVRVAREAGARCLLLFHHDPDADDGVVDRHVQRARQAWPETWAAAEGLQVACRTPGVYVERVVSRIGPRITGRQPIRVRGKSVSGAPLELKGFMANVTLKGTYLVVPEWDSLQPEVEIDLLDGEGNGKMMRGHVVRIDVDPETGHPAIGVVFTAEETRPAPAGPRVRPRLPPVR
ncbi:MAG: MBL fold metallo-hydrolase [Candidatus Methylomirabilales bacterium]